MACPIRVYDPGWGFLLVPSETRHSLLSRLQPKWRHSRNAEARAPGFQLSGRKESLNLRRRVDVVLDPVPVLTRGHPTATHRENSEVLSPGSVAVAVMNWPGGIAI